MRATEFQFPRGRRKQTGRGKHIMKKSYMELTVVPEIRSYFPAVAPWRFVFTDSLDNVFSRRVNQDEADRLVLSPITSSLPITMER